MLHFIKFSFKNSKDYRNPRVMHPNIQCMIANKASVHDNLRIPYRQCNTSTNKCNKKGVYSSCCSPGQPFQVVNKTWLILLIIIPAPWTTPFYIFQCITIFTSGQCEIIKDLSHYILKLKSTDILRYANNSYSLANSAALPKQPLLQDLYELFWQNWLMTDWVGFLGAGHGHSCSWRLLDFRMVLLDRWISDFLGTCRSASMIRSTNVCTSL